MRPLRMIIYFVIPLILLSACASKGSIEISCDEFYENPHLTKSIEVGVGDEIVVNLCSNASTGFQWIEIVDISDPGILEQISHEYISPPEKGEPPPPGTPGSQMWTFKALKEGESVLSFEYSRNWEGGEKGAWTYVLTVEVR